MPFPELPPAPPMAGTPAANFAALMVPASQAVTAALRIACRPSPFFFLRHHEGDWEVVSEGLAEPTLLPVIGKHPLVPGVAGMRTTTRGMEPQHAHRDAIIKGMENGWVYLAPNETIPAELLPSGVPVGGYCRAVPCADPLTGEAGTAHLEAWQVPVETVVGERQQYAYDRSAYNRWRLSLVKRGVIKPPKGQVKQGLTKRARRHLERAAALPLPEDLRAQRVEKRKDELDLVLEAMGGDMAAQRSDAPTPPALEQLAAAFDVEPKLTMAKIIKLAVDAGFGEHEAALTELKTRAALKAAIDKLIAEKK